MERVRSVRVLRRVFDQVVGEARRKAVLRRGWAEEDRCAREQRAPWGWLDREGVGDSTVSGLGTVQVTIAATAVELDDGRVALLVELEPDPGLSHPGGRRVESD